MPHTWLALALSGCWSEPVTPTTGTDVVFLTVDTLRADHVGFLDGASPAETPFLDGLAADGIVFSQAFSPISVTGPAFVSLMTGQTPSTHGVLQNTFQGADALPSSAHTLAEALRSDGHRTSAFVSGFTLRPDLGLDQGFDTYDAPGPGSDGNRRPGDETAAAATRWLKTERGGAPDFLWFHTYDAHGPWTPYTRRAPVTDRWERDPDQLSHVPAYQRIDDITDPAFYAARYAEAVTFADGQVGAVVAALKAQGRYDDALIVVTADHGETLAERELRYDHGTHATVEQLHVPLVVKLPGNRRAGERSAALVSLVDVAPTVLRELGLPALPHTDGQDLTAGHAHLLGESSHCKDLAVLPCRPRGWAGKELAVRDTERTVIRSARDHEPVWRVYDRVSDPLELSPLPAQPPDELRALLETVATARKQRQDDGVDRELDADARENERRALKALGYLE